MWIYTMLLGYSFLNKSKSLEMLGRGPVYYIGPSIEMVLNLSAPERWNANAISADVDHKGQRK